MSAAEGELLRLEELLRRPDFILEPRAWDTVVRYIKAKGKPESIIDYLSENYVGACRARPGATSQPIRHADRPCPRRLPHILCIGILFQTLRQGTRRCPCWCASGCS